MGPLPCRLLTVSVLFPPVRLSYLIQNQSKETRWSKSVVNKHVWSLFQHKNQESHADLNVIYNTSGAVVYFHFHMGRTTEIKIWGEGVGKIMGLGFISVFCCFCFIYLFFFLQEKNMELLFENDFILRQHEIFNLFITRVCYPPWKWPRPKSRGETATSANLKRHWNPNRRRFRVPAGRNGSRGSSSSGHFSRRLGGSVRPTGEFRPARSPLTWSCAATCSNGVISSQYTEDCRTGMYPPDGPT